MRISFLILILYSLEFISCSDTNAPKSGELTYSDFQERLHMDIDWQLSDQTGCPDKKIIIQRIAKFSN